MIQKSCFWHLLQGLRHAFLKTGYNLKILTGHGEKLGEIVNVLDRMIKSSIILDM